MDGECAGSVTLYSDREGRGLGVRMKVVVGGRNGRMAFLRWVLCLILEVLTLGLFLPE
jgi:hypothetical protein